MSRPQNCKAQYIPALTSLRGVAAIWVMLFHLDVLTFYRDLGSLAPRDSMGLITKGYLWVDFFFVLSGFVIRHTYLPHFQQARFTQAVAEYLRARFWRVYPLHFVTLIFLGSYAFIIASLLPRVMQDSSWNTFFDGSAFVQSLFLLNAHHLHSYLSWNIVSWSIGAEWWTYLLAVIPLALLRRPRFWLAISSIVAAYAVLATLVYGIKEGSLDITFDYGLIRCLAGFTIGFSLHCFYSLGKGRFVLGHDLSAGLLLGGIAASFHWQWPDLIAHTLMTGLVLSAAYNTRLVERFLSARLPHKMGQISYSIYLVHGVIFMLLWFLLPLVKDQWQLTSFTMWQHVALWLVFITTTLLVSTFTYTHVERRFRRGLSRQHADHAQVGKTEQKLRS